MTTNSVSSMNTHSNEQVQMSAQFANQVIEVHFWLFVDLFERGRIEVDVQLKQIVEGELVGIKAVAWVHSEIGEIDEVYVGGTLTL